MLKNSPTHFENIAVQAPQDFWYMFGHFQRYAWKGVATYLHLQISKWEKILKLYYDQALSI